MGKQRIFRVAVVALVAAAWFLPAMTVFSHDYWLEPEDFFLTPGSQVKVHLLVGEGLKSDEERVLQKEKTPRFQLFFAGQNKDLLTGGTEGQSPVTQVTCKMVGNYLIAMERDWSTIKLDARKFTNYLKEEGLDSIIAERQQRGESQMEGRERYSRYLKSLMLVGGKSDGLYKRVLGQRLEILPQSNPYELKTGEKLQVQVLFEGKPLSGAKVFACNRTSDEVREQAAVTSTAGRAEFIIDRPGVWLVRLVHMRRCEKCADADWESFWGAYSFGRK